MRGRSRAFDTRPQEVHGIGVILLKMRMTELFRKGRSSCKGWNAASSSFEALSWSELNDTGGVQHKEFSLELCDLVQWVRKR